MAELAADPRSEGAEIVDASGGAGELQLVRGGDEMLELAKLHLSASSMNQIGIFRLFPAWRQYNFAPVRGP